MPRLLSFLAPAMGLVLAVGCIGLALSSVSCSGSGEDKDDTANEDGQADGQGPGLIHANNVKFVGAESCAKCHETEHKNWVGSHHEQAMKKPTEQTVLGDFNNTTFTHFGTTSRFFKKDGKFFVHTDGPDGEMADFEVAYTYGVEPLQQYLIKFRDGSVQALTIAWDTRPKEEGGQQWYHLYPDEPTPHNDALHWAGPNFTWNHMCAECHSTDLKKNYNPETKSYKTTWAQINVSCESCHGPGEHHVEWAESYQAEKIKEKGDMGLLVQLKDESRVWVMDGETGIAKRQTPLKDDALINACARCHSRRSQISDGGDAGVDFLNNYMPSFLTEGLYYPDGQIQDEVYVWGSFVQSKMHMAGVTCMDCHDPHTARVPTTSNDLCAKCHAPSKFDAYEHHKHPPGSPGASCVDCHMPHRTYMGVDKRRDHSLRVPRPDLSVKLGAPNACNQCHTEQSKQWAADAAAHWWGVDIDAPPHYGEIFAEARKGTAGTDKQLVNLLRDEKQPPIVRGTAVIYLARYPTRLAASGVFEALASKEKLVRLAATDMLRNMPADQRITPGMKALGDSMLAIRIEAADALVDVPKQQLTETERKKIAAGIDAYRKAQMVSADTAAGNMNLALLAYRMGDADTAKSFYQTAIEIDPTFVPAYSNIAELNSLQGDHRRALAWIDEGLKRCQVKADLYYTQALVYYRLRNLNGAIASFKQAYEGAPDRYDLARGYAVALFDTKKQEQAIAIVEKSLAQNPNNPALLSTLVEFHQSLGNKGKALEYAQRLQKLMPEDARLAQTIRQLKAK